MGYFSSRAIENIYCDSDGRWPSDEELLLQRFCDLKIILDELVEKGAVYRSCIRLTDDEIRCAAPDYFITVWDAERAIELAARELKDKYGIDAFGLSDGSAKAQDEIPKEQISLFEIIPLHPLPEPQKAA